MSLSAGRELGRAVPMKAILLIFLALLVVARSEDWNLPNGKVFKNVKITSKTATHVSIVHDGGTARFDFKDLTNNIRSAAGFDEVAYKKEMDSKERLQKIKEKEAALIANSFRIKGLVDSITKDGVFVIRSPYEDREAAQRGLMAGLIRVYTGEESAQTPAAARATKYRPLTLGSFVLTDFPECDKLSDNQPINVLAIADGTWREDNKKISNPRTLRKFKVIKVLPLEKVVVE